ncbi:MAG: elongation factor P--(R)-beta-lysine ligase [Planctomycetaceae bacterium]|nr:MAG: elongation factor P--(R)-beta-lysine ligase [Planctomycetaceae bacterium]
MVGQHADDLWRPTASLRRLRQRAALLHVIREFFHAHSFWEVETPLMSQDIVVDAWLEPICCEWMWNPWSADKRSELRYLQTSPEFAMKRLLAAGADAIYQLGKVFRNGEYGPRHNPEFTLLEWYRIHSDIWEQMELVERLVRAVMSVALLFDCPGTQRTALRVFGSERFERLSYDEAFVRYAGEGVLGKSVDELQELAERFLLVPPPSLDLEDRDGWLNWLLAELVEPHLGVEHPVFVWGFPASQAALAETQTDQQGNAIALRFELYIDGVELCNGYQELRDVEEYARRVRQQAQSRESAGLRPLPEHSRLMQAMAEGLPPCAGVALGVDRLVMLALGASCLDEVLAFPFPRA